MARAKEGLAFAAELTASGYVNLGGLFLALVPEVGVEESARPILAAMGERGTWIFEYREPEGKDVKFMRILGKILGVEAGKRKILPKKESAVAQGRLVWELQAEEGKDRVLNRTCVAPVFRTRDSAGTEISGPVKFKNLETQKYSGAVSERDKYFALRMAGSDTREE